ncbi:phosphoribosylamine--glycine ligase [Luteibacter sp. Sphag1AF]|uniref:phosphoribosylamine--glycine ligase n=1 Tax=Luteibacter sp. Sphag1AF TaxID=2587031 RepID=UPI001610E737|nr:phosphoribosylamine--glycine ligase [Luteibacter sp. Sphag1AF]MBB3226401.1 phosphoribosylamine--glycine ligase [Luteibacter sp. Sphag1AF]
MKVLVIGSGGREHALAWKLSQSPRVTDVIVAPGNAGTAREPGLRNAAVAVTDIDGLLKLAQEEGVELTVVGPEVPLVAGVVDRFTDAGLRCFGPRAHAAQLEGSKAYAKAFLERHGIPTAHYAVFTELAPALAHVREKGAPIVIKADGLAAGKGVVVAMTLAEAEDALNDMLGQQAFGDASSRVVIEQFLEGEEASFIVIADGKQALPMATSQDHKRRDDGDQGPNTGGMGAYSPAPVVTQDISDRVMREIIQPTLDGMAKDGAPFTGFLYAGLMIDASGAPRVIEFNVRFGDPETQPIMLRLKSDLVALIEAALDGDITRVDAEWDPRPSLGVVLAAGGYPGKVRNGDLIEGADADFGPDVKVFHAGTAQNAEGLAVSAGGRVLTVCALGDDLAQARARAYEALTHVGFADAFYRHDIAHRALR